MMASMTVCQQTLSHDVYSGDVEGDGSTSSNESKIGSGTLYQQVEADQSQPENADEGTQFEEDNRVPHGTNYKDFVLFSDIAEVPELEAQMFFEDADATTTAGNQAPTADSELFAQQDITHNHRAKLYPSTNLYDSVDIHTFDTIDSFLDESSAPVHYALQPDYSTTTHSEAVHYDSPWTTSLYDDSTSTPLDAWAKTEEYHPCLASRFPPLQYDLSQ